MSATPSQHALTFGAVDTDCVLLGRAGDALAVRTRLERTAREALPTAVADALEPALEGRSGVVRIDRVQLDLDFARGDLEGGELLRRWAERLAETLAGELSARDAGNVARFDDHADFAAAYLELRFGEARHPAWAFADFAALDHVAPERAAVELLRARPEWLGAVARRSRRRGRTEALAERLSQGAILELLDVHAGVGAVLASADALRKRATSAVAILASAGWHAWAGPRRALALALRLLAEDGPVPVREALQLARVTAALYHFLESRADDDVEAVLRPAALRRALERMSGEARAEVAQALVALAGDAAGRALLHELVPALAAPAGGGREADRGKRPPEPAGVRGEPPDLGASGPRKEARDGEHDDGAAGPERAGGPAGELALVSPVAGVALTLTTVRRLGLHRLLPPPRLWDTLVTLLVDERHPAVDRDPLLAQIAPFDARARDGDWPRPAAELLQALAAPEREAIGSLDGAAAWSRLLAAGFAAALPGLAGSSTGYLRRQFLHTAGSVQVTPEELRVTLEPVALGVVLRMAGMTGWQGPLPWLAGRDLHIEIRG